MFVLIHEFFHCYKPSKYYVDSNKLDIKNSILDALLMKALKKKSFTQELEINVEHMREVYPEDYDWFHPRFTEAACKKKLPKDQIVEKHVDFYITTFDKE